jgi:hypothetical protein
MERLESALKCIDFKELVAFKFWPCLVESSLSGFAKHDVSELSRVSGAFTCSKAGLACQQCCVYHFMTFYRTVPRSFCSR